MISQDDYMLISIFCDAEDFCKEFEPEMRKMQVENRGKQFREKKQRNRKSALSLSEALTIVIMFHKTRFRTFKDYYKQYVLTFLRSYFPNLLSKNNYY